MSGINAENNPAEGPNVTAIKTVTGCHHFVVKDLSSANRIGSRNRLSSNLFKVGGYKWAIYFYPGGFKNLPNYASVFLALASDGTNVRAMYEFTLVDQSGEGRHIVRQNFDKGPDRSIFNSKGLYRGFREFIRRSDLKASNYWKNDCLVLHCKVAVVKNCVVAPRKDMMVIPPSDMGQAFLSMFERGVCSDVVFHVESESFKAHKVLLAARSSVFMAQFYGDSKLDEVIIEDVKPSIFKAMITFIYSDELPDVHEIADSSSYSSETVIQHLLTAAERYGLARLKLLCEAKLHEEIMIDSISSSLEGLGTQNGVKRGPNDSGEQYVDVKRLRGTKGERTLLLPAQVHLSETCCA